jgi:hypothetical protein
VDINANINVDVTIIHSINVTVASIHESTKYLIWLKVIRPKWVGDSRFSFADLTGLVRLCPALKFVATRPGQHGFSIHNFLPSRARFLGPVVDR